MDYQKRLYIILFPNHALVASHLTPEQFAHHYQLGSGKYYGGKVIFAEINAKFRNPYFNIDKAFKELIPHSDGAPKKTKFISSYRVLEHLDLDMLENLYLSNESGKIQPLEAAPYDKTHKPGYVRTFAEICPLSMMILSSLNAVDFGAFITQADNPKGSPQLFFTQVELDADAFLEDFAQNPLMNSPLPFVHPSRLRDGILEIKKNNPDKPVKGLSVYSDLNKISFRRIRHGFWFTSQTQHRFYPMPSLKEISEKNPAFYRDI